MKITDFNYRIQKHNNSLLSISTPISFGNYLSGRGVGMDCKSGVISLVTNQKELVLAIYSIGNIVGVFVINSQINIFKDKHVPWDNITHCLGSVLRDWIEKNIVSECSER